MSKIVQTVYPRLVVDEDDSKWVTNLKKTAMYW